jgi:TerC family integral membrane protein
MHPPLWFWVGFHVFVLGMLALDLGLLHRRARVIGAREAAAWTGVWVGLALLFAAGLAVFVEGRAALTFLTGYVVEESLSVDNIFVIVLIFSYFKIPPQYQHRVLFWGILGALAMRGAGIATGGFLLDRFPWVSYVFGTIVLLTAIRMVRQPDEQFAGSRSPVLRALRRVLPVSETLDGQHFFTREPPPPGRLVATPLFLALVLIEVTDLIFATDSIPAIFAITRETYLVYTSNVFAVLGLRSLFFLISDAMRRFRYLDYGIAVILAFIGLKLILEHVIAIPVGLTLGVVALVLAVAIVASLLAPAEDRE